MREGSSTTSRLRARTKLALVGVATAALCATVTTISTTSARAADNPFQRGPDPTEQSITATRGTYAISSTTVGRQSNFAGGTIYYPTSTADGTFGGVVLAPGFTESQSSTAWLSQRLASFGFVAFSINTNSTLDQPAARATQMANALKYLTTSSSVRTRVDGNRLAVGGHSMGGGGTLIASRANPQLKAAIPMEPWSSDKNFSTDRVPTLIFAAQNDSVAPVGQHANQFFNSLPASTPKGLLELKGASHFVSNSANVTVAKYALSWLKRYVDNDTRYTQFLCPKPDDSSLSRSLGFTFC